MRLRNNKVLKKDNLELSIEYETEISDNSNTDTDSVTSSELHFLNNTSQTSLYENNIAEYKSLFSSYNFSESDDEDSTFEPEKKQKDNLYLNVFRYFSLNEEEKIYFKNLSEEKQKIISLKKTIENTI